MTVEAKTGTDRFSQEELSFVGSLLSCAGRGELRQEIGMGKYRLKALKTGLADRFNCGGDKEALILAVIYAVGTGQIVLESELGATRKLTQREGQIFAQLAEGYKSSAIAEHAGVHKHSIEAKLENVFSKLGVLNRFEAAALVHQRIRQSGGKLSINEVIGSLTNP